MNNRISEEELMENLKELGTFRWLVPEADEKDYRFQLNLKITSILNKSNEHSQRLI